MAYEFLNTFNMDIKIEVPFISADVAPEREIRHGVRTQYSKDAIGLMRCGKLVACYYSFLNGRWVVYDSDCNLEIVGYQIL